MANDNPLFFQTDRLIKLVNIQVVKNKQLNKKTKPNTKRVISGFKRKI